MRNRRFAIGVRRLLVILLLVGLTLSGCGQSMQREPEIPVNRILQVQSEVLPAGWQFRPVDSTNIYTDRDFTWATWMAEAGFYRKRPLEGSITEEFHVFANSPMAQSIPASSAEVNYLESYVPGEWSYTPPNAERFEFECTPEGTYDLEWCEAILRYDEYVIYLTAPIAEYFTLQDFQQLLEVTDQEMTEFLRDSSVRPGPREAPTDFK